MLDQLGRTRIMSDTLCTEAMLFFTYEVGCSHNHRGRELRLRR